MGNIGKCIAKTICGLATNLSKTYNRYIHSEEVDTHTERHCSVCGDKIIIKTNTSCISNCCIKNSICHYCSLHERSLNR